VRFELDDARVAAFGPGTRLAVTHRNYAHETELGDSTLAELAGDLRGD
jgi:hypothetical protein